MGLNFSFGREVDIPRLYGWTTRFYLQRLRCWGIFIGNTFIGIARARK